MLYPIELLGPSCRDHRGRRRDGVHLNGTGHFCHVVFGLQACGPNLFKQSVLRAIMHFALLRKATIAKRMLRRTLMIHNQLIYKGFFTYLKLACRLQYPLHTDPS